MFSNIKCILFMALIYTSFYAQEKPDCKAKNFYKKYYDQGSKINKNSLMQAYNASAEVNLTGKYDVFIQGDIIWWQPKEKGLSIATSFSATPNYQIDRVHDFHSNFSPGFKIGIGARHHFDDWSFFFLYTWFNADHSNSLKKARSFTADWTEDEVYEAHAKWKLKLNLIEIELSRKNLTGKNVVFSPLFTICGGWLDQRFSQSTANASSLALSDSWLLGPKGGIKTFWKIKSHVKILANISASLFYQNYSKVKYELRNNSTLAYTNRIQMQMNYITPSLNFSSGLSYEINFRKRAHATVQVMYEILHFWNQNQMRYLLNELKYTRFDAASLTLHGITASMRWNF